MEEVARRHDLPWPSANHSISGQEDASSFRVDQELLERIRSVLASHEIYSASQSNAGPGKETYAVEAAQEPSGTFDFSTAKSVAGLAQSSILVPNVSEASSGGLVSESSVEQLDRDQNREAITKRIHGRSTLLQAENPFLNDQAQSSRVFLSPRDPAQRGRASRQVSIKRPPSDRHHVPGSYRSEHDTAVEVESTLLRDPIDPGAEPILPSDISLSDRIRPDALGLESQAVLITPMANPGKNQFLSLPDTTIPDKKSKSLLQSKPEQALDGTSTPLTSTNHRLHLKPSAVPSDMGLPAPPVLTQDISRSHAAVGTNRELQQHGRSGHRSQVSKELRGTPINLQATGHVERSLSQNGKPLVELLSDLPPLNRDVIDDFEGKHLTAKMTTIPREISFDRGKSPSYGHGSESRRWSISRATSRTHTVTRSDSYKSLAQHVIPLSSKASSVALDRGERNSSTKLAEETSLQKRSPLELPHQSISRMSSVSTRSNEVLKHKPSESSQPLPQQDNVASSEIRHVKVGVHPRDTASGKHWIRHLLQKTPHEQKLKSDPSYLTARPSDRKGSSSFVGPQVPVDTGSATEGPIASKGTTGRFGGNQAQPPDHDYQRRTSESFSKIILELEELLNEAIYVARRAAEQNATEELPSILEEAALVLKGEEVGKYHPKPRDQHSSCGEHYIEDQAANYGLKDTQLPGSAFESDIASSPDSEHLTSGHLTAITASKGPIAPSNRASVLLQDSVQEQRNYDANHQMEHRETLKRKKEKQFDGSNMVTMHDSTLQRADELSLKSNITTPRRFYESSDGLDWATSADQRQTRSVAKAVRNRRSSILNLPPSTMPPMRESFGLVVRANRDASQLPSKDTVHEHIRLHREPPIQPRISSSQLNPISLSDRGDNPTSLAHESRLAYRDGADSYTQSPERGRHNLDGHHKNASGYFGRPSVAPEKDRQGRNPDKGQQSGIDLNGYSLKDRHHFSIREPRGLNLSLSRSHRHQPIARDWSDRRKRYVAAVACISTALIGLIVGIYAGEVPAIQYQIVDFHHYTILGNVFLYIGLAITTFVFWPLPLLHGRKPYTLLALVLLLPLQFPQALVVGTQRSPYVATYRVGLLLPRALSGLAMGFANINFKATLLDLFGASLQSSNPHQEIVNDHDVRRHGGGMGIWLGIWTWCSIGSIGLGFFIGAAIISSLNPAWGFWIAVILTATILLLNVLIPEVRRSPYRRSVAEVRSGTDISRRIARGEVKMHLESTGPKWWWEEVSAGLRLCSRMFKQPGFAILSVYLAWIYGQIVIVIVLLGALISKYYRFRPEFVGLCVAAVPLGALVAVPFQKASIFSRSRRRPPRTDSMTFQRRVTWTSHLLRRLIFMISLPFADLAYTLSSTGPPVHYMVPTTFAAFIGFLSNLAIAECNGIIMETYDTSDLQPGMTGRPRSSLPEDVRRKRTNFSCFPRVSAGLAITQSLAFIMAAVATGVGGTVERNIGARAATGVVAGILFALTLLLTAVLWRSMELQVIPSPRTFRGQTAPGEDGWRPVIIGNPSGKMRRMNVLELGEQSRWTEIRRKNRLI